MHRAISSGLVGSLLGLVLVAPASCAKGNNASPAEVATPAPPEGDAGPDAACAPCFADQVCSAGACVSTDTDADSADGKAAVDCDDTNAMIHPGAPEICNGKDDDCNGTVDEIPASLTGQLSSPVNPHWQLVGSALLGTVAEGSAGW